MLPAVLHTDQIRVFNFYYQNILCQGMTANGKLYRYVDSFSREERFQAFEKACQLSCHGRVILAVKPSGNYDLWADACMESVGIFP
ncbi:MAG TPA: hypothetical protein V6D29_18675 [Leptolyngbyaceae cyanobacterium]